MDSFFELIFGNFFIVIIIIVAIINMLSKTKTGNQSRDRNTERESTQERRTIQERLEEKVEQVKESYQQAAETLSSEVEETTNTFEDQRQAQYEQLKQRIQSEQQYDNMKDKSNVDLKLPTQAAVNQDATEDMDVNNYITKNLTKQGLAESIVMAEVLGPPRALNPYQNIAMKRRRNQ